MEDNKTLLEVFEEIKENELDFLPNDENVREGFMTFIKFISLAS
ncbi:MAG: hypothetical protein ACOWWH_03635 [Eubacteriaceae bacterium]